MELNIIIGKYNISPGCEPVYVRLPVRSFLTKYKYYYIGV